MTKDLKNIPIISSVKEIKFKKELFEEADPKSIAYLKKISGLVILYEITYISQKHKVIGYLAKPKSKGRFPCIILNRGGSKNFEEWTHRKLFKQLNLMASWGYVCITTQYSGNGGSEGKDEFGGKEIQDVLTLYEILKLYKHADASRISMFGASRGGLMAYLILSKVDWLRAIVSRSGITDMKMTLRMRPELKSWLSDMFDTNNQKELDKRSPIKLVKKFHKHTPILLLHGTADARVSVLDSLDMAIELHKNKIPYRMIIFEGADHFLTEFKKEETDYIKRWFDTYVKNCSILPDLNLHGK